MEPSRAGFALALALPLLCRPAPCEEPFQARAEASLSRDELGLKAVLGRGASSLGLGFETQGEGREFAACLRLEPGGEAGPLLLAGRGSASGPSRLLVDPCSSARLGLGAPVELDSSLESKTSVAALGSGPLSIFALLPKPASTGVEEACAGLSLELPLARGSLGAVGAAYFEGVQTEPSGWLPQPSASPLVRAADRKEPCFSGALISRGQAGGAWSLAALAASYGRVAGQGLAFRLEAGELLGPLSLRSAAAVAGAGFRELEGPRSRQRLEALLEARLALRRASSLSLLVEGQAEGESLMYSPLWGQREAFLLSLPLGASAASLEAGLKLASPCAAASGGSLSLALKRGPGAEEGGRARLGVELDWESRVSGLGLELETGLAGRGGLPLLGLDLALTLLDKGSLESPVLAKAETSLALPFGQGGRIELRAILPQRSLGPSPASTVLPSPQLGLRYTTVFSVAPSRRRPRSRISLVPKARSMAQRAASKSPLRSGPQAPSSRASAMPPSLVATSEPAGAALSGQSALLSRRSSASMPRSAKRKRKRAAWPALPETGESRQMVRA